MNISYDKQTINSPNPLARYAHRSRIRKSIQRKSVLRRNLAVAYERGEIRQKCVVKRDLLAVMPARKLR